MHTNTSPEVWHRKIWPHDPEPLIFVATDSLHEDMNNSLWVFCVQFTICYG